MLDFKIKKTFDVRSQPRKAESIKEVIWRPRRLSWMKCNSDGVAKGSVGIFIDIELNFVGAFACHIGINGNHLGNRKGARIVKVGTILG